MTVKDALDLLERLYYYEQHVHFDGYDITLNDFHEEPNLWTR
jgi:hypothetical protein